MKMTHLAPSMTMLSDMYTSYSHKGIYRLELGPYISTYAYKYEDYNLTEDISENINPDELFLIVFEVLLANMSDMEHMDDLEYSFYSQDEFTYSISEYTNQELDTGVLHLPEELIRYVMNILINNIDMDLVNNSVFIIKGYTTTEHSLIADVYIKERVEI